jgi:hypothetical protein
MLARHRRLEEMDLSERAGTAGPTRGARPGRTPGAAEPALGLPAHSGRAVACGFGWGDDPPDPGGRADSARRQPRPRCGSEICSTSGPSEPVPDKNGAEDRGVSGVRWRRTREIALPFTGWSAPAVAERSWRNAFTCSGARGAAGSSLPRLTANQAMAQAYVLTAGSHGRCPWLSAISPARTPARTDIWRTGPAAKITSKRISAGQEPFSQIRADGL